VDGVGAGLAAVVCLCAVVTMLATPMYAAATHTTTDPGLFIQRLPRKYYTWGRGNQSVRM
jgi:hypothetical protein